MSSSHTLRIILMVRRRREEAAERALTAIGQEILRWQCHIEKWRGGLAEITAARIREIENVRDASHHQSSDAQYRAVLRRCAEAENKIERLQAARAEQMAVYVATRREREVAEKLEEQSRLAHEARIARREQKWNEDMFLARKVSNSNRTMDSKCSIESKESA